MSFKIILSLGNEKYELNYDDSDVSISKIKSDIRDLFLNEVEARFIKLCLNGKITKNENSLKDYVKVSNESNASIKGIILLEKGYSDQVKGKQVLDNSNTILKELKRDLEDVKARILSRMISVEDAYFDLSRIEEHLLQRESEIIEIKLKEIDEPARKRSLEIIAELKKEIEALRSKSKTSRN